MAENNKNIRLDKFLANMGAGSRSDVKNFIKKGRVSVNEEIIRDPGFKVCLNDNVECDGQKVSYVDMEYYMLNKPAGVITATEDSIDKTVMELIRSVRNDLFPVGRLDKDTEGLLLITNDGELAHNLLAPRKHVSKKYYVRLMNELDESNIEEFENGIILNDGTRFRPAILQIESSHTAYLTIYEGKFHQVKRMFEAIGNKVVYLKRITMGSLVLDDKLLPGEYRMLSDEEINGLRRIDNE